ncbi:hypothetical protein D3C86_2254190 [compost metagenome]
MEFASTGLTYCRVTGSGDTTVTTAELPAGMEMLLPMLSSIFITSPLDEYIT